MHRPASTAPPMTDCGAWTPPAGNDQLQILRILDCGDETLVIIRIHFDRELQRAIEQIELSRAEGRRDDMAARASRGSDLRGSDTSNHKESAPGGMQDTGEAERYREADREHCSMPHQDEQVAEQQAPMPSEPRHKHPDERAIESRPVSNPELARSDPPQQHEPRLRQIEQEIEERQDRDRNDRDR